MNVEKDSLVTLENSKSYIILDQVDYEDEVYCFITDLIEEDSFMIIKKIIMGNDCLFGLVKDTNVENNLKDIFAKRLGIEM